ncbi:M48 family metalloprotease [Porticoccaceae bacterium]|nr:M48 family metalloprotease [Porticoccaceae bacterium]
MQRIRHISQPLQRSLVAMIVGAALTACAVNPVTGERELALVSEAQEIELGRANYANYRQQQGGDYRLQPELGDYVAEVGRRLAAFSDRPDLPYEFIVINNPTANAWALPGGKIAINSGLLRHLDDEAQLAAVIGHEIIHAAARHGAAQMSRSMLLNVGLAAIAVGTEGQAAEWLGTASQYGAAAWMARYGRADELESDYHGIKLMVAAGYDPLAAVELQETFVELSEARSNDFISALFASHPPSQERVDANRQQVEELGVVGERYRQRYQRMTAELKAAEPAYLAAEEAARLLRQKNYTQALEKSAIAVERLPRQGQFWLLRAAIWRALERPDKAEKALTTAIRKTPKYYLPYLQRAQLRWQRDAMNEAAVDYRDSFSHLQTAEAAYYLGVVAQRRGDEAAADDYFSKAIKLGGEYAQRATKRREQLRQP